MSNDGWGSWPTEPKKEEPKTQSELSKALDTIAGWGPDVWSSGKQTAHDEVDLSTPVPASDGWGTEIVKAPIGSNGLTPAPKGPPSVAPNKGWVSEELPHVWGKPPEIGMRGDTWPCDRGNGSRYYAGYANTINYVLLCGPYDTYEEAQARYEIAYARFIEDKTLSWIFLNPTPDNLTVLLLPFEKAMRQGAYGRL